MYIYDELKTAYGNHFQNLFSKLMKEKYGMRYQATSNYGNIGDMCVDGVLDFNIAFAVYAPETYKDQNAIEKLKSDFYGFIEHKNRGEWNQIQKYVFVIKRERFGSTSTVLDVLSQFNKIFPVGIMTMADLEKLEMGYLAFSDDGHLLNEFKSDVTEIMEYIVDTDFSAEPFRMSLWDDINSILIKWSKKRYSFKRELLEELKNKILRTINEICKYLSPLYVHPIDGGRLMFNNNSLEAGERLKKELQPETLKIRYKIQDLLEELYSIK